MAKGFTAIPHDIKDKNYFRWVLNGNDRNVLIELWRRILTRDYEPYRQGLLIINMKLDNIAWNAGLPKSTAHDSLKKLDYLGVIIQAPRRSRNHRYLVGFRTKEDERLYLIQHLINRYEQWLEQSIESKRKKFITPVIKDLISYQIEDGFKDFIFDHINNYDKLLNTRLKDNKTIFELLFDRNDIYKKPLPRKAVSLDPGVGA